MLQALLGLIPLVSGATVTVQSAVNGKLRSILGNPLFISAISFAFGTLLLFILMMILHLLGIYDVPAFEKVLQIKWWLYIGGVIGAIMVIGTIALPKKNRIRTILQHLRFRPAFRLCNCRCHRFLRH